MQNCSRGDSQQETGNFYGPTATSALMRRINRSTILSFIRRNAPVSRSQIARRLSMSLPTVMRVARELIDEGLVREDGLGRSTGGRPSSLLAFNGDAYAVIGVDLGGSKMLGVLADLTGSIQHETYLPHSEVATGAGPLRPVDALEPLSQLIGALVAAPRPVGQQLRGIGVGVPSVVLNPEGVVSWAPALDWRNLPLRDILSERFGLPVAVENDVNLAALGEMVFGAGQGARDLLCIAIGTGIGAGIVIGGAIHRGHHQAAGEMGYMLPGIEYLGRTYDQFGALETLASGDGIADRACRALGQQGVPVPRDQVTAEYVFSAARRGEQRAREVVDETVDYLGLAIANASMLLDPEVVVLGGGVAPSTSSCCASS